MTTFRWTSRDLDALPDDGRRYEIIDGELYVSEHPHISHQIICGNILVLLEQWSNMEQLGVPVFTPGVIFADDDDVVPDVVWISHERLANALEPDGKLHSAPELAIEVLSPGATNERRDRETKLKLYSRRGVLEYWVASWQERRLEVYRRDEAMLKLVSTLYENDMLQSPYLPGFRCQVSQMFANVI